MARRARVIVPGCPHHLTHRGNRGGTVFYDEGDRGRYTSLLSDYARRYGMEIWAYCLMTNHVHLIVLGDYLDSISRAIGNAHRHYSRDINFRRDWTGHLWGNRFFSTPLDETHLWAAVRYVEQNPVRAGMVRHPADYPWSSARAHALGAPDSVLSRNRPFPGTIPDWRGWIAEGLDRDLCTRIRLNTMAGRPTGSPQFVDRLENLLARRLRPKRRGPKPLKVSPK